MENKEVVEVGVAIIKKDNQVLVAKRPQNKVFGGKWEFPGGKFEPLELPEECINREIKEELGVTLKNLKQFLVKEHQYPGNKKFRLYFYFCEIAEGEPQALWHDEISWIEAGKLDTIDLLSSNIGLTLLIKEKLI